MTPSFLEIFVGLDTTIISEKMGSLFFRFKTAQTLAIARIEINKTKIVLTLSKVTMKRSIFGIFEKHLLKEALNGFP